MSKALAGFLAGKTLGADQTESVNLIVDHVTGKGVMDAASSMASLPPRRSTS
jgi:hypothetical protein